MGTFKALVVGAVVGVLLAVFGVAALASALDPSADEVWRQVSSEDAKSGQGSDAPPAFYGER